MTRSTHTCKDRGCPDLILIPGLFGYRCRHSGAPPRYTGICKLDATQHPVHTMLLPPSSKNCKGCDRLQWEEEGAYRRRVCMWHDPPRIPGNINCPLRPEAI